MSSGRKLNLSLGHHSLACPGTEELRGHQVQAPASENARPLFLHLTETDQPWNVTGLEFHHNVHIAVRTEIIPQHRTEQRQPANAVAAAELTEPFLVSANPGPHPVSILHTLRRGGGPLSRQPCYPVRLSFMTVVLDIPDEIAGQLAAAGQDLSRAALEALALEAYRRGALTQLQVGQLLGLPRLQTEDFLAQHAGSRGFGETRPISSVRDSATF